MVFIFKFGLTVHLSEMVESQIISIINGTGFSTESGGILVGYIEPLKNSLTITDMTFPQKSDRRTARSFVRKPNGHQNIMNALWRSSGFEKMYVGEWHTHNSTTLTPSPADAREWIKRAREQHNTPYALFLIVGPRESRLWTVHNGLIHSAEGVLK